MGFIGGRIGYSVLRHFFPRVAEKSSSTVDKSESLKELNLLFGQTSLEVIRDKTVIDFGCGIGTQAVQMALCGAGKVIGLDIQEDRLMQARQLADLRGVVDRCRFAQSTDEKADIIVSKDAFEHFSDPLGILVLMASLLKPEGFILASFGPTWLHPRGGHLFSVFPWAHLIFTEKALIRWRSEFKSDGATRFSEVEGGLNQLTIRTFECLVEGSPCKIEWLETIPIRGLKFLRHHLLREWGTSLVRCKLIVAH